MSINQERVHELFNSARYLAVEDRNAFLDKECGDDAELRSEIESLLKYAPASAVTRETGTIAPAPGEVVDHRYKAGDRIGEYEIIREIGEGGFGVVYFAKQHEPVEREVALKVLLSRRCTDSYIRGFETERQTLANMNHPGIAHFYDAGLTQHNQPFFVMEFVSGQPITDYCDEHRLTIEQRLSLFADVCKAVQHAHNKGVIHRDLTPNNILVSEGEDGTPRAQIIDFGIARKTDEETADVMGTLVYMSPEQATKDASVDTRSDIYTLGVVLYELLVGKPPLDAEMFKGAALKAQLKLVKEQDPPTPSTKLSGILNPDETSAIAEQRQENIVSLLKMLRRELNWIPSKALQKDPERRYETASEFGEDISRYLNDEVLVAVPDSAGYRFKKSLKRHKGAYISAAIVFIVLLAGITGTASGWKSTYEHAIIAKAAEQNALAERNRAVEAEVETEIEKIRVLLERDKATKSLEDLEKLANVLIDMQLHLSSSPTEDTLREILKNANAHLHQISGLSEVLQAKVRLSAAYGFITSQKFSEAEKLLLDAQAVLEKNYGAKEDIVMMSNAMLAICQIGQMEMQADRAMSGVNNLRKMFQLVGGSNSEINDKLNTLIDELGALIEDSYSRLSNEKKAKIFAHTKVGVSYFEKKKPQLLRLAPLFLRLSTRHTDFVTSDLFNEETVLNTFDGLEKPLLEFGLALEILLSDFDNAELSLESMTTLLACLYLSSQEELFEKILAKSTLVNPKNISELESLFNIISVKALIYSSIGNPKAETEYLTLLNLSTEFLGRNNRITIQIKNYLLGTLEVLGKLEEAKKYRDKLPLEVNGDDS